MKKFELQQPTGDIPQPRFGHSMTSYTDDKLCLFGGAFCATQVTMADSAYSLNMNTLEWRKI